MPVTSINFGPAEADLVHKKQALHRAGLAADRTQKLANEFAPTGVCAGPFFCRSGLVRELFGGRLGAAG